MILLRHCEIRNANTDAFGGVVPLLLDCIVHNCGSIADDDDDLLPCDSDIEFRYNTNCASGIGIGNLIGAEHCVFYNLETGFNWKVFYSEILGTDFETNNLYLYRNTFVDINKILDFYDHKANILLDYDLDLSGYIYSLFEGNLTANIDIFGKSNLIPVDLRYSLINGANLISIYETSNILENVSPLFIDYENHNFRLVHAGMTGFFIGSEDGYNHAISTSNDIQKIYESIPLIDSPGIIGSNDIGLAEMMEDMGAYLSITALLPHLSFNTLELAMPEKTDWELATIRGESNEGLFDINKKWDYQYNVFNLKYDTNLMNEGNKLSHAIRTLRSRNEPIRINPFSITVIPPEVESSRILQSQIQNKNLTEISNYHNFINTIIRGDEGFVNTGFIASEVQFESWRASSYVDEQKTSYTGSCIIDYSAGFPIIELEKIDFNWFEGFHIAMWNSSTVGENTEMMYGKIIGVDNTNKNKINFEYKYLNPYPSSVTDYDRVIIRPTFWWGLVSLANLDSITPSTITSYQNKLIHYQEASGDYGLRIPVGIKTEINEMLPYGALDGFILSFCGYGASYNMDLLFYDIINGTYTPPSESFVPAFIGGGRSIEDDKYIFRMEAKYCLTDVMTTNVSSNENWEFYDLVVLNPENPFNWSSLSVPEIRNIIKKLRSYCDYCFMGSVDGFIADISEGNIKNVSPDNTFFEKGSEWEPGLEQFNQYGSKRNTWKEQEFSLTQRHENRQFQPFTKVRHPEKED